MHYSYEYKRKCVELYREGRWPETPDGITDYIDYYNNEQVILEKEGAIRSIKPEVQNMLI